MVTLFNDVRVDSISAPKMWWTIQYEYKRDEQNPTNMLYNFHWKVYLTKTGESYFDYMMHLKFYVNGSLAKTAKVKDTTNKYYDWAYEGQTGWITVSNKTSGTTPFYAVLTAEASQVTKATSSTYQLAVSGASSVLGAINNFDIEGKIPIKITKYDSAFTDTLVVHIDTITIKTVSNITNGEEISFTPEELDLIYGLMQNEVSKKVIFTLITKSNGVELGKSAQYAMGSISNANPIWDSGYFTYNDVNPDIFNITRNPLWIVQNKSTLAVQYVEAEAQKGANISKYIFELNGVVREGAVDEGYIEFGTINSANNLTLTATAIDTRGNKTTATQEVRVFAWQEPSAVVELARVNNYEDETHLKIKGNISSVNGINQMNITYLYKQVDGNYSDPISVESNTKTVLTCDKNHAYIFWVRLFDSFGGVFENEYPLSKGVFPLFIDTEKNAVGINDFPAKGEALRVAGGTARFCDGIVLCGTTKNFLITVNDSGVLNITELK